jgi:hypothetical protein
MKELIRHILKEEINHKKLNMIKKYVEKHIEIDKNLKGNVCEVSVQSDRGTIVVDIFIDDNHYTSLDYEYNLYFLQKNIESKIIDAFGIKNRYDIIVYTEKCSSDRLTYD